MIHSNKGSMSRNAYMRHVSPGMQQLPTQRMLSLVAFLLLINVQMCYITHHCSYFFSLICPETLGFSCDQNNLFLLKFNAGLFSFLQDQALI